MQGTPKQLNRARFLNDLAGIHDSNPVCNVGHDSQIVRDQKNRHPKFPFQTSQEVDDLRLNGDVQSGRWFICNQEPGLAGQRHGDHDPLLHAA
jgi:hypothetical protein